MKDYLISVIIPVRNGGETLDQCLQSLKNQTIADRIQLIVLNSMSTDNSREIAVRYNAIIETIPTGTFDHGLTRNKGVALATGDLIFFTVQDARIADPNMLEQMVAHFVDEKIMAVCGYQAVPNEKDKNPVFWRKTYSQPVTKRKEVADLHTFRNLSAKAQKELVAWDNVVAMYRKNALLQQPFVQTAFAEDWLWSYEAVLKGWTLIYDPSLLVYHYHHSTFAYTFQVNYIVNYHFYKYFKFVPTLPPLFRQMLERCYHLGKNRHLTMKEKLFWMTHNLSIVIATTLSVLIFLIRLKIGSAKSVEMGLQKYCRHIPQGQQKIVKKAQAVDENILKLHNRNSETVNQ